jgi:hypothetical protein
MVPEPLKGLHDERPFLIIETTTWPRSQPRREDSWSPMPRRPQMLVIHDGHSLRYMDER